MDERARKVDKAWSTFRGRGGDGNLKLLQEALAEYLIARGPAGADSSLQYNREWLRDVGLAFEEAANGGAPVLFTPAPARPDPTR